jgi:hypothetical protein
MRNVTLPTGIGLLALAAVFILCAEAGGNPKKFMMRARVDGQMIEGQPVFWTDYHIKLLGRDGRIHQFDKSQAKETQKTSPQFFGYTMSEMKQDLYREFGKTAEISTTQHYIVVHPAGQKSEWADRFEKLYRSFNHYFRVRGFQPKEPPYPLVAIVFRTEAELYAYAASQGDSVSNVLGYYSHGSNRIALYDQRTSGGNWTDNADTIIHEATHQTASNVGVHTRFSGTPKWVAEGLATMFEARGVYDHQLSDSRDDRINEGRLRDFKGFLPKRREGFMYELIATDTAFDREVHQAYAEAWALTFFLVETRPRQYAEYLQRTADREMFGRYSALERLADFQEIFHKDLKWFEAQFLSYMKNFK